MPHLEPNLTPTLNDVRGGVNLTIFDGVGLQSSPEWSVAGWNLQFARLAAGQELNLKPTLGAYYVKVITGQLANLERAAYARPREVRNTRVPGDVVVAGNEGALVALFTETDQVADKVESMEALTFTGPLASAFTWQSFEQRFTGVIDFFDGADAHIVPGFHLLDEVGDEIAYVHFWTAGKGVNLSTHNHANAPSDMAPAFAEFHWVLSNGTGSGGMYECDSATSSPHTRYPMQRGDEHGPFFDLEGRKPKMCANGAVSYPWHGWQAGRDDIAGQAYDFVAAFEITAKYAEI